MEVASPLSFAPTAGNKRSLAYSPQMLKTPNRGSIAEMDVADESMQHSTKRRRFNSDTSVESLSEHFSSHSPFFAQSKQSIFASSTGTSHHGVVTTELLVNVTVTPLFQVHWVFFFFVSIRMFFHRRLPCSFFVFGISHRYAMNVFTHDLTCSFAQPPNQLNVSERMPLIVRSSKI
jgi:hypothetical protein